MSRYYCLGHSKAYFLIIDKEQMKRAVLSYTTHKDLILSSDFVSIKHNKFRPYFKQVEWGKKGLKEFVRPSTYLTTDYCKKHNSSRTVSSIDILPIDTFLELCQDDADLASLLVVYDIDTLYDRPILCLVQQSELRLTNSDWVSLI